MLLVGSTIFFLVFYASNINDGRAHIINLQSLCSGVVFHLWLPMEFNKHFYHYELNAWMRVHTALSDNCKWIRNKKNATKQKKKTNYDRIVFVQVNVVFSFHFVVRLAFLLLFEFIALNCNFKEDKNKEIGCYQRILSFI